MFEECVEEDISSEHFTAHSGRDGYFVGENLKIMTNINTDFSGVMHTYQCGIALSNIVRVVLYDVLGMLPNFGGT